MDWHNTLETVNSIDHNNQTWQWPALFGLETSGLVVKRGQRYTTCFTLQSIYSQKKGAGLTDMQSSKTCEVLLLQKGLRHFYPAWQDKASSKKEQNCCVTLGFWKMISYCVVVKSSWQLTHLFIYFRQSCHGNAWGPLEGVWSDLNSVQFAQVVRDRWCLLRRNALGSFYCTHTPEERLIKGLNCCKKKSRPD